MPGTDKAHSPLPLLKLTKSWTEITLHAAILQPMPILSGMTLISGTSRAELPTPIPPSGGAADGDWLGFFQGWADDAGTTLGLVLGMVGFAWVSWALIAKFNEARSGKAEWGEVGLVGGIAGVLMIFMVYMLTESADVI